MRQDLRDGWRALRHATAFTVVAVLTLALGITGTTVMFALLNGVLLRPLPVHEQDRLVVAWKELRSSGFAHYPFGDEEIRDVASSAHLFEAVAGVTSNGATQWIAVEDRGSSYMTGALVTGSFFDVLGVRPILGRSLKPADDVEGAEAVVVISQGLWIRHYGGSPDVLGRRLTFAGRPFAIVGVMPREFEYPQGAEVWRTTRSVPLNGTFGEAARRDVDLVARLRPGVTIDQAAAELTALTRRLEASAPPDAPRGLEPSVRSLKDVLVGGARRPMLILFAAVVLVLLAASANTANLLLLRSEARREELAVRIALGAGSLRIARLLIVESLLLTLMAAGVASAVSWWSLQAIVTVLPAGLPRAESVRIDGTVIFFTTMLVLTTALLAGFAPGLWAVRSDLASQLRGGGRGAAGPALKNGRRALVIGQAALAVIVLSAAGLLSHTFLKLQALDLGLAADRLVFVSLALLPEKYRDPTRHQQLMEDVIARLETAAQIQGATPVHVAPFSGTAGWDVPRFTAEGQSAERAARNPSLNLESIHHNYFRTFDVPIVRGRAFTSADRRGALDVAIVSEDVAAQTWPGEDPIGKRLKMGGLESDDPWRTVVGVAASTRYRELRTPRATLYLPAAQFLSVSQMLVLRTNAPLKTVASLARETIGAVDPDVPVMRVAPFSELLATPLARPRFDAILLNLFAAAALVLATVGLYATLAAWVRQRDREIGIRVALGATPRNIRRLVLIEGLSLAGTGAGIGLAGALLTTRVIRSMLFDIDPLDVATIAGAALVFVAAAALACYVPVRRAVRIDAAEMLRS